MLKSERENNVSDETKKEGEAIPEELRDEELDRASGGVIESIGVKYTLFSPDGEPLRSSGKDALDAEPNEKPKLPDT